MITRHQAGEQLHRHRHRDGYMAVVLSGGYVEAGSGARIGASAGDVILHNRFDAHQDRFGPRGAVVLNLPMIAGLPIGTGRIADPDDVARTAERDPVEAAAKVAAAFVRADLAMGDWVDLLAAALSGDGAVAIAEWADRVGVRPSSLSRGFRRAFGVSPKRYRLEQRTLQAVDALPQWRGSLADLATAAGFADQAHMTRAITAMTGAAPGYWRV